VLWTVEDVGLCRPGPIGRPRVAEGVDPEGLRFNLSSTVGLNRPCISEGLDSDGCSRDGNAKRSGCDKTLSSCIPVAGGGRDLERLLGLQSMGTRDRDRLMALQSIGTISLK
jgi:hypothetical protein